MESTSGIPGPSSVAPALDRPRLMGILNVTPDSFSDGGLYADLEQAIAHGLEMVRQGVDILDVGGESTRPGAASVDAAQQKARVIEPIRRLRRAMDEAGLTAWISIDTTLVDVAQAALDAGATILNDVSAGLDPRNPRNQASASSPPGAAEIEHSPMLALAAQRQVPIVLMHMQGEPRTMQERPHYDDVVTQVETFLLERASAALAVGLPREHIWLDPGIGFGKTREHNLALLGHLDRLTRHGFPVVLGTSRKRFLGFICQGTAPAPPPPRELIAATCATTALGVLAGAMVLRVHDVAANRQAADVAWAIKQAR